MSTFSKDSTTDEVIAGISLAGKTAVVTGASAGLGIETCRVLAAAGATVVMLARDEAKLAGVQDAMAGSVESAILDLADLDSVRAGAADILARFPKIDILINNAGIMACPLMRTAQGFEIQFGTNHLGHFLLTCLLAPNLAEGARVINLSSAGHRMGGIQWDDPNYEHSEYAPWPAYGQAKTANVLFSVGLDARLKGRGVRSFAVHPGAIHTELARHLTEESLSAMLEVSPRAGEVEFKSIPQGAATSVWAATSPELAGQGGLYCEDCHIAAPAVGDEVAGVESYATDPESAERLWALSEKLLGQRFEF